MCEAEPKKNNAVISIKEVFNIKLGNVGALHGSGGRLGMKQMLNAICGYDEYDGYEVVTENEKYLLLISNGQSCCES